MPAPLYSIYAEEAYEFMIWDVVVVGTSELPIMVFAAFLPSFAVHVKHSTQTRAKTNFLSPSLITAADRDCTDRHSY